MISKGLFVARQHTLETLAKVDHLVFDKTGTLTNGELSLVRVETLGALDAARARLRVSQVSGDATEAASAQLAELTAEMGADAYAS